MKIKVFDSKTLKNIIEINLDLVTKIKNECIIGRSPESGIVLDSSDVSRMHAKLILENGDYYFCDLGSRNGSLINGKVAETSHKYLLNAGDTIRLGEFVLILEDVNTQTENITETVYRNFDATVVASLRDSANFSELNQSQEAEQVPEVVNSTPEEVISILEEVTNYQDFTKVQTEKISVSEDAIETTAEIPQVVEAVNQSTEIIEVTDNSDDISSINELEEITSKTEPYLEPNVSEEISEVSNHIEITDSTLQAPEVLFSTSENIVAIEETLESNIEPSIPSIEEAYIFEEEIIATTTPIVLEVDQTLEETIIQTREEIPITETTNVLSSEEVNEIYEPEIAQLEKVNQTLVSSIQSLEITNETSSLEEAQPEISMASEISEAEEDSSSAADIIDNSEATSTFVSTVSAQNYEEVEIESTDVTDIEPSEIKEENEIINSEKPELISTKYIALLAHDSKRFEIAQFVTKHQDFFSKCLTIAPPSISEILSSQASINITEQTSAATSGGYQAIAAKAASGDILTVIFLRDFLQAQSNTANEEAMLRVCNINQVMVATNLPTAEAIVSYIQTISKT
ncbi:MAG: FHA domain-containing protein [Methylacidiphilales bacterium]|nr:FHA domain-containing protein [Candidatus Methylacidiphilales bacterium]NJR16872.1 FHA domain-containing protein [Calothrix sp. CSU_2_0]